MAVFMAVDPFATQDFTVKQELDLLEQLAKQNVPLAQETLGYYLVTGRDFYRRPIKANPKRGLELLNKAAQAGTRLALSFLIELYSDEEQKFFDLETAEAYCEKLIEKEDGMGYYLKGKLLKNNRQKIKEAADCFALSHEKGMLGGTYELAILYMEGAGVERDLKKARELIEPVLDKDRNFLTLMGELYLTPEERDLDRAAEYFAKAVKKGAPAGKSHLAQLWLLCPKAKRPADYKKRAETYLESAMEAGDGLAYYVKGVMYQKGIGCRQDAESCYKYFELARVRGYQPAEIALAGILTTLEPEEVEKSEFENMNALIKIAVKKGIALNNPQTYNLLGHLYEKGRLGKKDLKKAYESYLTAGKLGDGAGYFNCGRFHLDAVGMPVDREKAEEFYRKAIGLDHLESYTELGFLLSEPDLDGGNKEGLELLKTAAEYGDDQAMDYLGDFYWKFSAVFTADDLKQASYYYNMCAVAVNPYASFKFALIMVTSFEPEDRRLKKVVKTIIKYLKAACEEEIPQAFTLLGKINAAGFGVKPNPQRAFEMFRRGAEHEDPEAHMALSYCYQEGFGVKRSAQKAKQEIEKTRELFNELPPDEREESGYLFERGPEGAAFNLPQSPVLGDEDDGNAAGDFGETGSRFDYDQDGFVISSDIKQ